MKNINTVIKKKVASMQSKVSMIVTCYNKVKYIGKMFDSIISQEWNNIELILVNDGSTDGTRDVITEYESKFYKRGYDVVIIDQENEGVCAATKAGLSCITGKYVCIVDADDELDPTYISTMAGWLEEHHDTDYCICDAIHYEGIGNNKVFKPFFPHPLQEQEYRHTERYLLTDIRSEVWVYLVRTSYLQKCHIVDTYYTYINVSQEPGFIIPLIEYGGKYKYFPFPLYYFNVGYEGHSRHCNFESAQKYYDKYDQLCRIVISALPYGITSFKRQLTLITISHFSILIQSYRKAVSLSDGRKFAKNIFRELLYMFNLLFEIKPQITEEEVFGKEILFIKAVISILAGRQLLVWPLPKRKIIGYGALGKAASELLPLLDGTSLNPTELWDIAGNGINVKKPKFLELDEEDILLVFPMGKIEEELRKSFESAKFTVIYNTELQERLKDEFMISLLKGRIYSSEFQWECITQADVD